MKIELNKWFFIKTPFLVWLITIDWRIALIVTILSIADTK